MVEPGHGAGGLVLESGCPFRSDNMADDPRITRARGDLVELEGLVATLVVPIMVEGRVEGLLYVHRRTPKPFNDRSETVLRQLAEYAAIAIHNMRMLAHEHQMRAEAESASRTKDEFLATLSHELRSPLQPLLNWAYLLRSPNLDPASAERALDAIERSTKTLGQLIEDLLDVSRIVTGKLRLQARPVRLSAVVRAAMEAVEPAALAKAVTLEVRIEPELPAVMGDPDRLQQVLWNLLSNGIKFTPKGGRVTVTVAGPQLGCDAHGGGHRGRHQARVPAPRLRALPPGGEQHQPGATAASGSAWPSCGTWSSCTGAAWRCRARAKGRARRSACACRWRRRSAPPSARPRR